MIGLIVIAVFTVYLAVSIFMVRLVARSAKAKGMRAQKAKFTKPSSLILELATADLPITVGHSHGGHLALAAFSTNHIFRLAA